MDEFQGFTEDRFDLGGLKSLSDARKPSTLLEGVTELVELYEDSGRATTESYLSKTGLGLADNTYPLQVDLLRYIVHRISPVYARAPVRYLERPTGKRYAESTTEHRRMLDVVQRAQLDLAWRDASRLRSLVMQVALRFYPVDSKRAVVVRTFLPNVVHRLPDAAVGDVLDEDRAFALELSGGVFECWWRDDAGWHMVWTDDSGKLLDGQPFDGPGYLSPYAELPVLFTYDRFSGGKPWLPLRVSRTSWALSLNGISNDLLAMVARQTHNERVYKTSDPNRPPPKSPAPGETVKIHASDELENLTSNPQLEAATKVLDRLTAMWLYSEDLDPASLSGGQPATGAALRVRSQGLQERREGQVPLAHEDERQAWAKLRAVHNAHASDWGVDELTLDADMRVEIADLDIPEDQGDLLDNAAKSMALGADSLIDIIQQRHNLSRTQAIARYERVAEDLETYPPPKREQAPAASDLAATEGAGFTEPLNALGETQGDEPVDSVTDALGGRSAAQARSERRTAQA